MPKEVESAVVVQDRASDVPPGSVPQTKKSWKSYVWDTFDKPPRERKFLFKLDAGILTITCLGMWVFHRTHGATTQAGMLLTRSLLQDILSDSLIRQI